VLFRSPGAQRGQLVEQLPAEHGGPGDQAVGLGRQLLDELTALCARHPETLRNPRGRGLLAAVTLRDAALRDEVLRRVREEQDLLLLPCGPDGIRFRPALTVSAAELSDATGRLDRVLSEPSGVTQIRLAA